MTPSAPLRKKVFLVNVGVNSAHDLYSPLFEDGSFEFVPIPEGGTVADLRDSTLPPLWSYSQLECYREPRPLLDVLAPKLRAKYADALVHCDPALGTYSGRGQSVMTYGDIPFSSVRAASLRSASPGDVLLFLARLTPIANGSPHRDRAAFYLLAFLEIGRIIERQPGADTLIDAKSRQVVPLDEQVTNAHVRQVYSLPQRYWSEHFLVINGSTRSRRFQRAVIVDEWFVSACLRTAQGSTLDHARFRSFQASVGSHTRTVRPILRLDQPTDRERFGHLVAHLGDEAGDLATILE